MSALFSHPVGKLSSDSVALEDVLTEGLGTAVKAVFKGLEKGGTTVPCDELNNEEEVDGKFWACLPNSSLKSVLKIILTDPLTDSLALLCFNWSSSVSTYYNVRKYMYHSCLLDCGILRSIAELTTKVATPKNPCPSFLNFFWSNIWIDSTLVSNTTKRHMLFQKGAKVPLSVRVVWVCSPSTVTTANGSGRAKEWKWDKNIICNNESYKRSSVLLILQPSKLQR